MTHSGQINISDFINENVFLNWHHILHFAENTKGPLVFFIQKMLQINTKRICHLGVYDFQMIVHFHLASRYIDKYILLSRVIIRLVIVFNKNLFQVVEFFLRIGSNTKVKI